MQIQPTLFVRNKLIVFSLVGLISIMAGVTISFFLRFSHNYVILAEVSLFIIVLAAFARKIKRFLLGLLIITIPINIDKSFFLESTHTGGVPGLVISVWSLVLISLYIIWFYEYSTGTKKKIHYFPYATIPLGLLLVICILSTLKSGAINPSIFQIFQMIKVLFLFFYIANNIQTKNDYKFVLYALFFTLFLEIGIGYYQHFRNEYIDLGIFSDSSPHKVRELDSYIIMSVTGTMSGSHPFADYLIMVLYLLLAAIFGKAKGLLKISYIALFVGSLPLLILTLSRGAWLGFGIGLCIFFALKLIFSLKKPIILFQIFIAVFLIFITFFSFKDLMLQRMFGEDFGSAKSRIPMMDIGFEVIKANPVLGVGINNYTIAMTKYDPTGITYNYKRPVHNVLIQFAAEVGIPGLIVFLWFLMAIYGYSLKNLCKSHDFFRNQLIGITVGITALFIHGMTNSGNIATNPFILFWLFSGLILSITKINQKNS